MPFAHKRQAGSSRGDLQNIGANLKEQGLVASQSAPSGSCAVSGCSSWPVEAAALVARIAEHHQCPITKQLVVDPVVAEDGQVYERRALERWLARTKSSPVTNRPMNSTTMIPATAVRQTVAELMEGGVLDDETRRQFFVARGQLRATRTLPPGPDLDGAAEDFQRAKDLCPPTPPIDQQESRNLSAGVSPGRARQPSPCNRTDRSDAAPDAGKDEALRLQMSVVAWMQEGVQIFTKARGSVEKKAGQSEELMHWLMEVADAMRPAVMAPLVKRLSSFRTLPRGTRVRVIDNSAELERLCTRPAPGARDNVGWNPEMWAFCGQVCTVQDVDDDEYMSYQLVLEGTEREFSFPYDAVLLVPSH